MIYYRCRTVIFLLLIWGFAFDGGVALSAPQAIIISGGHMPTMNYCRYYKNIEHIQTALRDWERTNLVADGPNGTGANGYACNPNPDPTQEEDDSLYDGNGNPVLTRQEPKGGNQGAATIEDISRAFKEAISRLKPGEPFVIYTTDHGNPFGGSPILWGQGALSADRLRSLIQLVPSTSPVILIGEQCFSEQMFSALRDSTGRPLSNACGFARAREDEMSFGEGNLAQSIDEMSRLPTTGGPPSTLGDAVQSAQQSLRPMSSIMATSDSFLEHYLQAHPSSRPLVSSRDQILGDCLFNSGGIEAMRGVLSDLMSPVGQSTLGDLKEGLKRAYSMAGVSDHISPEELNAKEGEALARQQDNADKINSSKAALNKAVVEWLKSKKSPLITEYESLIAASLGARSSDRLGELSKQIVAVESAVGTGKNPEFNVWAEQTRSIDNASRKNTDSKDESKLDIARIAQDYHALNIQEPLLGAQVRRIRNLKRLVTDFNALKAMAIGNDVDGMSQYLTLLRCEHTPIHFKSAAEEGK